MRRTLATVAKRSSLIQMKNIVRLAYVSIRVKMLVRKGSQPANAVQIVANTISKTFQNAKICLCC